MGRPISTSTKDASSLQNLSCIDLFKFSGSALGASVTRLELPGTEDGIPFAGRYQTVQEVTDAIAHLNKYVHLSGYDESKVIESGDQVIIPNLTFQFRVQNPKEGQLELQSELGVTAVVQIENSAPTLIRLHYSTKRCKELLLEAGHSMKQQPPASGPPGCALVFAKSQR